MRKILLIVALAALCIGLYTYLKNNKNKSGGTEKVEFAMSDINQIDRIEMKSQAGLTVELTKENDEWMVNGKYPAFKPAMEKFLNKTLKNVRVKGPVPKTARNNVIRGMVANAIKVNIYEKGSLTKSYYVGGANPDMTGTYMHMHGSETPYVTYIPGFDGIITPKFSLIATDWYSREVFDFEAEEIKSIAVVNFDNEEESFVLSRNDDSTFSIDPNLNLNQQAAKSYFALYKWKNFEGYAKYLNDSAKAVILKSKPYLEITVTPFEGEKASLKVFRKGGENAPQVEDKYGEEVAFDVERYFAVSSKMDELITVQEYNFGKLFVKRSDFNQ